MAGKVRIVWNSREVINAISAITAEEEQAAARRMFANTLKYVPVLNRKQRKWGHYFKVKHGRGRKDWADKIPGALKRSVKLLRSRFQSGGWVVYAGDFIAWYARIVEYGTKMRRQKKTGRFTGKMPAKKFMRKAITAEKRRFMYHLKRRLS